MQFLNKVDKENIMLVDLIYHNGKKETNYTDYLDIIYKDIDTGEKRLKTIENPPMEIYFTKEEYQNYEYNKTFMYKDHADKHTCRYRDVVNYIAKLGGSSTQNYVKQAREKGNYSAARNVHR
jgi:hypothetical protein